MQKLKKLPQMRSSGSMKGLIASKTSYSVASAKFIKNTGPKCGDTAANSHSYSKSL